MSKGVDRDYFLEEFSKTPLRKIRKKPQSKFWRIIKSHLVGIPVKITDRVKNILGRNPE